MTAWLRVVFVALSLMAVAVPLTQPPPPMRVLIATRPQDGGRGFVPAEAATLPPLRMLIDVLGRQAGFVPDPRPPILTCEAPPRIVFGGTVPSGKLLDLRQLVTQFRDLPLFQIYDNPLTVAASICPAPQSLAESLVRQAAGLDATGAGTGKGVVIAIVDTGVDMTSITSRFPGVRFNDTFSSSPPAPVLGKHGTQCAYVAAIGAPQADIADVRVSDDVQSFIAAYTDLRKKWEAKHADWKALVVSTSWEFPASPDPEFKPEETLALGKTHPLLPILRCLSAAGADVVFAAGNGGACAASTAAGRGTITPPNNMPEVVTVAAVDGQKVRLGDSGQGGRSAPTKPDLSAYGSVMFANHLGGMAHTSAATAFAAGMTAALRSMDGWSASQRSPAAVRRCFTDHADKVIQIAQPNGSLTSSRIKSHSTDVGYGVMQFDAAVNAWKDTCGR